MANLNYRSRFVAKVALDEVARKSRHFGIVVVVTLGKTLSIQGNTSRSCDSWEIYPGQVGSVLIFAWRGHTFDVMVECVPGTVYNCVQTYSTLTLYCAHQTLYIWLDNKVTVGTMV